MYGQIGLENYQGIDGFGVPQSQEQVRELNKALEAGYQLSAQTGGSALRVESLEASLKVVTFGARHLTWWRKMPKTPAYSTVEEYNQLTSYGSTDGGFTLEGELPEESDSAYARKTSLVKYLGTTRGVTLPASMVNPAHGDLIAQENHNGILFLLNKSERAMFNGDSTLAFSGEGPEWDGMDRLIDSANIVDAEGQALTESIIQESSDVVAENFGYPTDLYAGVKPLGDLVKSFYGRERIQLPAQMNGQVGHAIQSVATQNGEVQMNSNVFLKDIQNPPSVASSAKAPASPASIAGVVSAGANDGDFEKAQGVGVAAEYAYAVTAANRFGESAPVFIAANVAMSAVNAAANEHITLSVTNAAVIGGFPPEFFKIYRSRPLASGSAVPASVSDYSLIARVKATSQAASPAVGVTYNDVNLLMPFTSTAYLGEMTPSVLQFRQLAPLMRLDLAVVAAARRWMILLYGVPILFAPKKWVKIINIGRLS